MRARNALSMAIIAVLLVACDAEGDVDPVDGEQEPSQESAEEQEPTDGEEPEAAPETPGAEEVQPREQPEAEDAPAPDDGGLELEDPNEQVEDGVFRGEGILLPIPDGWTLDETAFAQGLLIATAEDGLQQMLALAVDTESLGSEVTFDDLVDANREQFPGEPTVDDSVELEGAEQAHLLRYDEVPAQTGDSSGSVLVVLADGGSGRLATFNYAAATEDFEDATAELLLTEGGIDPNSEPSPPAVPATPPAGTESPDQP